MGFDTYIIVGARTLVSWRKQTGALPRVLFQHGDAVVEEIEGAGNECEINIEMRSTVAGVQSTLDANGFGWDSSVGAYDRLRQGNYAEALLTGWELGKLISPRQLSEIQPVARDYAALRTEAEKIVSDLGLASPREDLEALGSLLASQWLGTGDSKVLFFDDIKFDEPFSLGSGFIGDGNAGS